MPDVPESSLAVFGRKPVIEALQDPKIGIESILVAKGARGPAIAEIRRLADARQIPLTRSTADRVSQLSRRPKQDQGVVALVNAPGLQPLERYLAERSASSARPCRLFVLSDVTNPANVGMIIRSVAAAGMDGVVLPSVGVADVGPLVIKASAGVAFRSTLLRVRSATDGLELLRDAGFLLVGLAPEASRSYFDRAYPARTAFVLGGETHGVAESARQWIHEWVSIPMARGVESLNVACAATALAYELVRRRDMDQ